MRRSKGALLPPIQAARPRRGDIYHALRRGLLEGVFAAGARLPSTRQAAADYGVSRGLMEEVFCQLTDEGFFQRSVGRGTFVSPAVSRLTAPRRNGSENRPPLSLSARGRRLISAAACREPAVPVPFNAGIADTSEFPCHRWRQLEARAARELGREALSFADPRGLPQLRVAIARYLAQFRGIRCEPGQIVVFNSTQQALNALSVLLLGRGDAVLIEDPSYLGARAAFGLAGAELKPVRVDEHGLRIGPGLGRAPSARLAYVTPSHQYPAGAVLSLERRIALLEWAAQGRAWIIEDDYDVEFRYEGQLLTAIFALDAGERTIYLGTLNKSMFVSLRLAYAVVPERLVEPLADLRTQFDGFTPPVRQMAMSLFMEEGLFSAYLRRLRVLYGNKRGLLTEALAPLRPLGWYWDEEPAGMHLLLRHKNGSYVRKTAAASRLDLALLRSYRLRHHGHDDGIFLRFGALDKEQLLAGSRALVAAAQAVPEQAR
jgi:GntR family transcriptional regulator/MocR family aminotransferase